jgi:hypothetical protein
LAGTVPAQFSPTEKVIVHSVRSTKFAIMCCLSWSAVGEKFRSRFFF